jgi:PDZ domain-containing protein
VVDAIAPDAPAAGQLQPTDVIVAADGMPVRTPSQLRRIIGDRAPGDTVTLRVKRGGSTQAVTVRTIPDRSDPKRPIIGIQIEQSARIRLPFKVDIDLGDVGGPSAGLAFALQVAEELGRDVDRGRRIAATGEIELDGTVAPIGGAAQKTIGVRKSGVDVFLVPAGDNAREARKQADGVRIIPVENFAQALRALATIPQKG